MNTSERTTVIAEGIALWAKVQNLPMVVYIGSSTERDWKAWQDKWPAYVDFVKKEQFALFDRVNATY